MGKKEGMLTRLEFARKMVAKTIHIVSRSSKPFFERALEDIYQNMAGNSGPASGDIEHIWSPSAVVKNASKLLLK